MLRQLYLVLPAVLFLLAQEKTEQATAPDSILAKTVAEIPKGAQATVVPDALVVGEDKKCWLNKHQPTTSEDSGVVVHHMKDGTYEVEVKDSKLRWIKVPINGDMRKALLPVAQVHVPRPKTEPKQAGSNSDLP